MDLSETGTQGVLTPRGEPDAGPAGPRLAPRAEIAAAPVAGTEPATRAGTEPATVTGAEPATVTLGERRGEAVQAVPGTLDGQAAVARQHAGAAPSGTPGRDLPAWMARFVLPVSVVVVLAVGVLLRFWTRSDLWLDEALTVDIARLPVHEIPSYLRRDGAPPLFYVLLHFWMGLFGPSDLAVRSLSGVFGVATVPLVWLAGRRLGGPRVAWAATLLLATSPFAVRYDTETRMYALVAFLTVCGFLALARALQRPRPGNLVATALVTALLLYSHYWSLFLVGTVVLWLLFEAWRGRPEWRRPALAALGAVAVGCVAFVPWVPIFLFQSRHTGTPWAVPASFAAMVNAISSFAGGPTNQGRALALIYFACCGLGLFGIARDHRFIEIDLRSRPVARPVAVVTVGTLAAAIAGGLLSHSTFDARYASVVFVPLLLLVALGVGTFASPRVRTGVLAVAVLTGLVSAAPNVWTNRTQAGQVAATLASLGRPGDIVAYCPDQLGPAVNRLLPPGRYSQITFPRETGPAYVDWVDYAAASAAGRPVDFAQLLEREAGRSHQIWFVWAPGYQTFGTKCETIFETLQADSAPGGQFGAHQAFQLGPYYQPMELVQYAPRP